MKAHLIALTAAATLATLAGAATAQQSPAPEARPAQERPAIDRADLDALTDARIAAVQAGLKLTAAQQALWPPVERAVREIAADRAVRQEQRRAQRAEPRRDVDFLGRLERQAAYATGNAENLTGLTTAMKPFWASLDERQKRLLPVLLRPARAEARWARSDRDDWRRQRLERRGGAEQPAQRP